MNIKVGEFYKKLEKEISKVNPQVVESPQGAYLVIKGKRIHASFNLFDRKTMKYKVLIGKKTLKQSGFSIDARK